MSVEFAVATVRRLGGVARRAVLRRAGVSRGALARAVWEGRLIRPRQGVYALDDTSAAVLEALSHRGSVACVTAGRDYGLWILDDGDAERVHTWVHAQNHTTRLVVDPDAEPEVAECCVFHRDDPVDEPSLGRVGVVHCLLQILTCRGEECFFAALESALRLGLLDDEARERVRRHVPARSRWLVDFARSDADSGLESLLRLRLHRHGLALVSQVDIPGVGHVDFVIGDCLILEADGATHEGEARHRDRVRDAAAMTLGFSTLRFDYAMIVHDWPLVEAAILSAIGRNLHRSHAGLTW